MYLGDFAEDGDLFFKFTTRAFATGIPTTLAGSPVLSVYKDEGGAATEKTTAEAYFDLDVDHDSIAGWNNVRIDLSGDAFFATGADYSIVITTGTVDSVNVFGENIANFSIENRSMGQPAGATLAADVAAIKAETVLILADTDDIGVAGAGLTDLGGMSTGMKAEVEVEANDALVAQKLDHLVAAADGDDPVDGSIMAHIVSATEDWSTFVPSTDSLQALRDRGDAAWVTATGFALASVVGALNDTAAADEVTTGDTLVQYIKQLINILVGAPGVVTLKAAAAPASGVSLSEMIRAIYDDTNSLEGTKIPDTLSLANINAEVDTALDTAISEISQGVPTATPTVRTALMLMYMALRNKLDVPTSGTDTLEIHNDAGTRIAQKLLTDAGGDYSEAKMTSGA